MVKINGCLRPRRVFRDSTGLYLLFTCRDDELNTMMLAPTPSTNPFPTPPHPTPRPRFDPIRTSFSVPADVPAGVGLDRVASQAGDECCRCPWKRRRGIRREPVPISRPCSQLRRGRRRGRGRERGGGGGGGGRDGEETSRQRQEPV